MSYSDFLKRTRKAAGLKQRELAAAITARGHKVTTSSVSNIENGYYRKLDGSETQPAKRFVELAAEVCGANVDEALQTADYAPKHHVATPRTLPELIAALESLGIERFHSFDPMPDDSDGEAFREAIERIYLDIQLVINRYANKEPQYKLVYLESMGEMTDEREPRRKTG